MYANVLDVDWVAKDTPKHRVSGQKICETIKEQSQAAEKSELLNILSNLRYRLIPALPTNGEWTQKSKWQKKEERNDKHEKRAIVFHF